MGRLLLAEDTRLSRKIAIKVLLEQVAADSDRLARFEQEARAAAAPNYRSQCRRFQHRLPPETAPVELPPPKGCPKTLLKPEILAKHRAGLRSKKLPHLGPPILHHDQLMGAPEFDIFFANQQKALTE